MPQVHGAVHEAIQFIRSILATEINSATDNPLIFLNPVEVLSGGNFHAQPIALVADLLSIATAQLANISERRIEYLLDPNTSCLAGFLTEEGGLNSGFMIAQVTAASLVSENKTLAHPASVDSIPTSANKEDFVSMGTWAARKALQIVHNSEYVLAIELLCAVQGLEFKGNLKSAPVLEHILQIVRDQIPHWAQDRLMATEIEKAYQMIRGKTLLNAVEHFIGALEF
jgi:histidine ammonia-lyase